MKVGEFTKLLAAMPEDAELQFSGNYPLGNLDVSSVHVHLDPPLFIVVMKACQDGSWQEDEVWDMDEQVLPAPAKGQFEELWNHPGTDPTYQGWDAYWKGSCLKDSPFVSLEDTKAWKNGWQGAADDHMDEWVIDEWDMDEQVFPIWPGEYPEYTLPDLTQYGWDAYWLGIPLYGLHNQQLPLHDPTTWENGWLGAADVDAVEQRGY